jgi:hypothetical protein
MRLPFTDSLMRTNKFDGELAILSDAHYSRQTPGSPQFMPPGETVILRNWEGTIVFGWLWQQFRADGERGVCCSIFRNVSNRLSSEVIREAEDWAISEWDADRLFTYIDPKRDQESKSRLLFQEGRMEVCSPLKGWQARSRERGLTP